MRYSKLHFFVVLPILIFLIWISCKPEERHPIPEVYVNFTINILSDPEFYSLRTPGNSAVITNSTLGYLSLGYSNSGVIVYNAGDGEFFAFDRTCPHDIPKIVVVQIEPAGIYAECPECGSMFVLPSMGYPSIGSPSKWPLKEYSAIYNPNTGEIYITN